VSTIDIGLMQMQLSELAMRSGAAKIGFADLSMASHPSTQEMPVGISLVKPMNRAIVLSGGDCAFNEHQVQQREEMDSISSKLGDLLAQNGYCWYPVRNNTVDQMRLTGELSHKMVAVLAGLGWIGKSALLITPEYGPGVRVATVLTDAPFQTSTNFAASQCGGCLFCVEACPVGAITGRDWRIDGSRNDLIDAVLCNSYRIRMGRGLGRKYSCACCLQACPIGAERAGDRAKP